MGPLLDDENVRGCGKGLQVCVQVGLLSDLINFVLESKKLAACA